MRIEIEATVRTSPELVFSVLEDPDCYAEAVPEIVRTQILSEIRSGAGTSFREIRRQGKREISAVMEIGECDENERIVFRSEMAGADWETVYVLQPDAAGTRINMVMKATPKKLVARLLLPLVKKRISQALAGDLEAVDVYCARLAASRPADSSA